MELSGTINTISSSALSLEADQVQRSLTPCLPLCVGLQRKKYKIPNVLHLLDDFLVVVPPFDDAHKVMEGFLGIFRTLGIPLSEKKTEGPCTELEYLGIILDSLNMESLFTARED